MTLAVFRADASPVIGGGHVMRCLALADRLRREGWGTAFACSPETPQTLPFLASSGHPVVEADDGAEGLARCWPGGTHWLVVDNYRLDAAFEARCRPWAKRILVIDDLADRRHDCDILLDPNLVRTVSDYRQLTPVACRVVVGPAYAPLRPQFAQWRERRLMQAKEPDKRILVSMGLSDSAAAVRRVLEGIEAAGIDALVALVAGAGDVETVRVNAAESRLDVAVHAGVDDMASLMAAHDLAVGAAGVSAWERCVLGLPTLIVVTAENQRAVARALTDAGAAMALGDAESITAANVGKALTETITRPERLLEMSRRAMAVCDGLGAGRVAMEMAPEPARDGSDVRLRPASEADSEMIFEWQSDPFTRRYFNTPEAPSRAEHMRWMATTVTDPTHCLNVILHGNTPVGVLRLDLKAGNGKAAGETRKSGSHYDVSILVARRYTGVGIGTAALKAARRLIPWADFVADVHEGNATSHALFRAAGYRSEGGRYVCQPEAGR